LSGAWFSPDGRFLAYLSNEAEVANYLASSDLARLIRQYAADSDAARVRIERHAACVGALNKKIKIRNWHDGTALDVPGGGFCAQCRGIGVSTAAEPRVYSNDSLSMFLGNGAHGTLC
jgi:hypothetical protein